MRADSHSLGGRIREDVAVREFPCQLALKFGRQVRAADLPPLAPEEAGGRMAAACAYPANWPAETTGRTAIRAFGPSSKRARSLHGCRVDSCETRVRSAVSSPTRSDAEAFGNRLRQLVEHRWGYSEVWQAGTAYPTLTLSISDELAVVHRFVDAEASFLLEGEGVIPGAESHDFLIQEVVVSFTGDFISTSAQAAAVIDAFARGADPGELGSWSRL